MKKKKATTAKASSVLVIGDLIFDVHQYLSYAGISGESGAPLGTHQRTVYSWGGAGLLVRNILALGSKVTFITRVGDDEYAKKADSFKGKGLAKVFFKEEGRDTVVKERFFLDDKRVLRVNHGDSSFISLETEVSILAFLKKNIKKFDKLIISDYRHGLLSRT